ncbi:MAG: hypothetical protein ACI4AX_02595 [Muribaculaceae bacterium]
MEVEVGYLFPNILHGAVVADADAEPQHHGIALQNIAVEPVFGIPRHQLPGQKIVESDVETVLLLFAFRAHEAVTDSDALFHAPVYRHARVVVHRCLYLYQQVFG